MRDAVRQAPAGLGGARGGMLRSLRHRDFRLFWIGLGVALTGFQVQRVGMGFLAYDLTGSALVLALVFAGDSIPMLLLSPIGGVVVDRVDRKLLLIVCRSAIAAVAVIIAVLTVSGVVEAWHLLLASLLSGVCYAFDIPARQAMIRDLVPDEDFVNAVALSSTVMQGSRIVGPALGGAALALVGAGGAFALWAAGQLGQVVMVALLRVPRAPRTVRQGALAHLAEGVRFIGRHELIWSLMVVAAVPAIFAASYQSLLPVFALDVLGRSEAEIGVMLTAAGVGALVGSACVAVYADRLARGWVCGVTAVLFSVLVIAFAVSTSYLLALLLLVLIGAAGALYSVVSSSVVQTTTPREMQGRVMGVYQLTWNVQLFGSLAIGWLADLAGAPLALSLAGGVSAIAVAGLLALRPGLRRAG